MNPGEPLAGAITNARLRWKREQRSSQEGIPRNWTGVALGYKRYDRQKRQTDEPCVTFFVRKKLPRDSLRPADLLQIPGVTTDVVEVGGWYALGGGLPPAPSGLKADSQVHCQADIVGPPGTAGALVREKGQAAPWILSANHVLSLNSAFGATAVFFDAPNPDQRISSAVKDVTIRRFDNQVDVAVAFLNAPVPADRFYPPELGLRQTQPVDPSTYASSSRLQVGKAGSATQFKTGVTFGTNPSITIQVPDLGFEPEFEDVLIVQDGTPGPFSAPGDSGSLVVDVTTGQPVGTLIARSRSGNLSVVAFLATAFDRLNAAGNGDFELIAP